MARTLTDGTRFARITLAGDLLGLLVFLAVGFDRHGGKVIDDMGRFLALVAVFFFTWLATAFFLGTYRPPSNPTLALTLVLAVPLGVLLRAWAVQVWTAAQVATFAGVAVVFVALFVGGARVITTWLGTRQRT
jgi:hypothetical protein